MKKIIIITTLLSFLSIAQAKDTIDALILYTNSALELYDNDDAKVKAQIKSQISTANFVFKRSGLNVTINPVLLNNDTQNKELAIKHLDGQYTSLLLAKNFVKNHDEYTQLKQRYKPDIVIVYRQLSDEDKVDNKGYRMGVSKYILGYDYTGKGFKSNRDRYSKLKKNSNSYYNQYKNNASLFLNLKENGVPSTNTVHELGHLLGIMHPVEMVENKEGYYPYSRGYGEKDKFTTIMGYAHSYGVKKPKLLFSSPSIHKCAGEACGIDKFDDKHGADAVSTIKDTAKILANFQKSPTFSSSDKKRLKRKVVREFLAIYNKYKTASKSKRKIYLQELLNKYFYEYKQL